MVIVGRWIQVLRLAVLLCIVPLVAASQQALDDAKEKEFILLIKGADWVGWESNRNTWKVEEQVLKGRSDGFLPAVLVVSDRDFSNFELRFEACVHRGSFSFKMRGPGPGPLGVALAINAETVEWFGNGTSVFVAASNHPDEWNAYRVVVREGRFKLWKNGIPAALELTVAHVDAKGQLSLHLSVGNPSEIALRRVRIKEILDPR